MTIPSAAVLLIGDELLSGRTRDINLQNIATALAEIGVDVLESRTVRDQPEAIVEALNALRVRYDMVFTSGGIGPTHDDITMDCIGQAFGVPVSHHPDAMALLGDYYREQGREFNTARQRMARLPEGAALIDNPDSVAPGAHIGNVYVLPGVPRILQRMLEGLLPQLPGGVVLQSLSVRVRHPEGVMAAGLEALQAQYEQVSIGCYPGKDEDGFFAQIVLRSRDAEALSQAREDLEVMISQLDSAA